MAQAINDMLRLENNRLIEELKYEKTKNMSLRNTLKYVEEDNEFLKKGIRAGLGMEFLKESELSHEFLEESIEGNIKLDWNKKFESYVDEKNAINIQAYWRGYICRRNIKNLI